MEENLFGLEISDINPATNALFQHAMRFAGSVVDYKELMMMYACAIQEIRTKLEILDTEYNVRYRRNPITSIISRLKKSSSIMEKLMRKNQGLTLQSIEEYVHDVAGIRVVCPYIDDIYTIAEALLKQDDITLVERKDYIKNPKPNGYRSLHLIVKVPVFFSEQRKEMAVEIQIRTIAMDFWASLEHQMKYKQEIPNQQEIVDQLKKCADVISRTDQEMLEIRRQIDESSDPQTEEDILLEKIRKLDINIM
ncbi:MAG: GTP pyrophosphokinase family protein [Lachnospiraceae bacterium]|nr:GTP pyrophosphokinase family protein [Lachnospiraceae bacterium]